MPMSMVPKMWADRRRPGYNNPGGGPSEQADHGEYEKVPHGLFFLSGDFWRAHGRPCAHATGGLDADPARCDVLHVPSNPAVTWLPGC